MQQIEHGWTPLHEAAHKGHTDVVQLLLERGAEPNMTTTDLGNTPLMLAQGLHKDKGFKETTNILREYLSGFQ